MKLSKRARLGLTAVLVIIASLQAQAQDADAPPPADAAPAADAAQAPATEASSTPVEAAPAATETTSAPAEAAATAPEAAPAPEAPAAAQAEPAEAVPVAPLREEPKNALKETAKTEDGATRLNSVEVTGSRLKRTDYESAQPVITLTREDLDRTGLTDISQILRQLSAAGNDSLNTQTQHSELTMGETNLDLRNLGAQHTLILVNGHRWVTGLVSTQPSVADLNTIPLAIIERIEILKDGASAVYGSDAIAGVVNIITRKDYDGLGISSQVGGYPQQHDGLQHQQSVNWGFIQPGRSLFINLSYNEQRPATVDNRPFTASPYPTAGFSRWGRTSPHGRFAFFPTEANAALYQCPNLVVGDTIDGAGVPSLPGVGRPGAAFSKVPAGVTLCNLTLNPGAAGGVPGDYHQIVDTDPADRYNYFADSYLIQPSTRTALYTQFIQELVEGVSFTFEGFYNARRSTGSAGNLAIYGGNLIKGDADPNGYADVANSFNPFGQNVGKDITCANNAAGNPSPTCTGLGTGGGYWAIRSTHDARSQWHFDDKVDTLRLGGGLKGELNLLQHQLSWEGGYKYTSNKVTEISPLYRFDKLSLAMGPDAQCTGDCVKFNPFQDQAGVTPAMLDYIYANTTQRNKNQQDLAFLDVSSEFDVLPAMLAGPLAVATGLEFRRDQFRSVPDDLIQQGLTLLNTQVITQGTSYAREAYVEIGIPLIKDFPLAQALDLDIAGRLSNYPRLGWIKTGKAGLSWKPVDDLLLRSTYSTGFRAPNIGEQFLGPSQSFDGITDPCASDTATATTTTNCDADNVNQTIAANAGTAAAYDLWMGNPNLKPETSKNLTYGLVFSPRWVPNLNINIDYYRIDLAGFVTIGLGQYFLDSCYNQAQRNYCDNIHRNSAGVLLYVDTPYFNYSSVKTSGIDLGFDYKLPLPESFGKFKLSLDASYLQRYDITVPQPGLPDEVFGQVGTEGFFNGYPRWKANGEIAWKIGGFSASWATRMAYTMMETCQPDGLKPTFSELGLCSDPKFDADGTDVSMNKLKTKFYHNVQAGYEFPWKGLNIAMGVNNVLDTDPPISYSAVGSQFYNFDPNQYETPGRFGYVRLGLKF